MRRNRKSGKCCVKPVELHDPNDVKIVDKEDV
jgi:hypothetical protein